MHGRPWSQTEGGPHLGLKFDDPEPTGRGREPNLPRLGNVADMTPRLVEDGGSARDFHGARVEVGDLFGVGGIAEVGKAEPGVPHRVHGEGGVGRVVDVVVVDAGVDLVGDLGSAVGRVVDREPELT